MGKRPGGGALTAASTPQRPETPGEGQRAAVTVDVRIAGRGGEYAAQTVDLSRAGTLLWITDEAFAPPEAVGNMVFYRQHVAEEFSGGMQLRFAGGVERAAEIVRVARKGAQDGDPILVACRFTKALSDEDCRAMGTEPAAAAEPAPPPAKRRPRRRNVERRTGKRVERILAVQLEGDHGSYRAHARNVSATGALITVTDAALAFPEGPERLTLFTNRMGVQFGNGMRIRFLEADLVVAADVVRVAEQRAGDEPLIVVGCRFRRHLSAEECRRLQVEPIAPGAVRDLGHPSRSRRRDLIPSPGTSSIRDLMRQALECGATDLHVKVGAPPRLRVAGSLLNVGSDVVDQEEAHAMALDLMTPEQAERFAAEGDVEFAHTIEGVGRFRVSVLRQRGWTSLAIRCIPTEIPTFESLGLLPQARILSEKPRGLVLVTGATGSGKTTTLAAMVHHINRTRACHIVTMEDPIEYVHPDIEAHITQREIGRDAVNFAAALRRALRQDPDVLLVGEMRDLETISLAITAAETGHLVFATLHTTSAAQTPDRIVDVFPPGQQTQIRLQLAETLRGVIAQMLVPRVGGGVALAQEILIATEGVRALIRENKSPQIQNLLQTGGKDGMQTLENSLNDLVRRGVVTFETAVSKANYPKQIHPR